MLFPSFMQAPITDQTLEKYLHNLAFTSNWARLKREFLDDKYIREWNFAWADNNLRGAYSSWHHDRDALKALHHLEVARVICNERFESNYLEMYNTSVAFLQKCTSRAGTPVHDQGV